MFTKEHHVLIAHVLKVNRPRNPIQHESLQARTVQIARCVLHDAIVGAFSNLLRGHGSQFNAKQFKVDAK